ncbi:PREDICTED: uncharacterized protein LOC103324170 [Prunus mume]|uniref:Uncharacterized protein LOC103324170 n=1 Tax=Prunus mume TaxID=102107 RepID=A0ABM0NGG1_PRUMU|nr:PREDICTED: uncharacterized protein LOC103324170 [Prunus mume]
MVVITVKTPAPQAEAKNLQEQKGKAAEIHEQATGRSAGVKISDSAARFRTLVYQDNKKVNRVFDGSKIGAPVEVKNFDKLITGRNLYLFFSGLNLNHLDIDKLMKIYLEGKKPPNNHRIVWIPVVKTWDQHKFDNLVAQMPWYSVEFSRPAQACVKLLEKDYSYHERQIVLVINPAGVVKNKNAHPAILRDERFAEFPYYT